jgi:hypothetical protein
MAMVRLNQNPNGAALLAPVGVGRGVEADGIAVLATYVAVVRSLEPFWFEV